MSFWRPCVVFLATWLPAGCGEQTSIGPPDILFGQDMCDVCGMIISDDRFAAALILSKDDGEYEPRAFDDIGCLLEFEAMSPEHRIAARYVRTFRSRQWSDTATAAYVHSRRLHSPMAFGLAACSSREEARGVQEEYGGDIVDFEVVRRRFDAGELVMHGHDTESANP